ncbi:MAG: EamA family transporter [Clostridia bacterium]|nr:EamA family transporter [Clostridia bacterium]
MIQMMWPILLAVGADLFYQICAKSMPGSLNPYAGLVITYGVGAVVCFIIYEISSKGGNIVNEWHNVNWTIFILGIAIVGLELGSIFMYRVGWNVNTGYIVKSIILATALVFVGYFLFKESITWSKVAGIAVCMVGLYLINR